MDDLLSVIPQDKGWMLIYVVVVLVLGSPAIFSKKTAEDKFWFFGKIASWFDTRKERSIAKEQKTRDVIATLDKARITELKELVESERDEHRDDMHRMMEEIQSLKRDIDIERVERNKLKDELNQTIDDYLGYIKYALTWQREVSLMAIQNNWKPELPEFQTFSEWRDDERG